MLIVRKRTVDADLLLTGLTKENIDVVSQLKGFIKIAMFDSWFEKSFLPRHAKVERNRL
jgi:hypothetical protein